MTQTIDNTTINIAIPFELLMDNDMQAILDLEIGENTRVLETDDGYEIIILPKCDLKGIVMLFDIAPYLILEKTYADFFHTGVDLEVGFITGLNLEMDLE